MNSTLCTCWKCWKRRPETQDRAWRWGLPSPCNWKPEFNPIWFLLYFLVGLQSVCSFPFTLRFQACQIPVAWPWTNCLASLNFSVWFCKVQNLCHRVGDWVMEIMNIKYLACWLLLEDTEEFIAISYLDDDMERETFMEDVSKNWRPFQDTQHTRAKAEHF